jgi:hypothetical protein
MSTPKKWGVCGNLLGAAQAYSGKMTSAAGVVTAMTASVDTTTEKLTMVGKVADGDYAGGIMAFSTCADLTAYSGFQFALGGTLSGCDLQFQLQTLSQQSSENSGGCVANADTGVSCYNFPKLSVTFDAAAPTVVHFADLVGTGMPSAVADFSKEIIGIQWQVQAGSGDCAAVNLTIDDVKLVTN